MQPSRPEQKANRISSLLRRPLQANPSETVRGWTPKRGRKARDNIPPRNVIPVAFSRRPMTGNQRYYRPPDAPPPVPPPELPPPDGPPGVPLGPAPPLPPAPEGPPIPELPLPDVPLLSQAVITSEAIIKQTATTFFIARSPYKHVPKLHPCRDRPTPPEMSARSIPRRIPLVQTSPRRRTSRFRYPYGSIPRPLWSNFG